MAERGDGRCDALIIGGGHNGLVCAAYLAAAGLKVTVLERRDVVGGAAVTEEFHPGFRNSVAAYTVSLLNPKVIRDLELPRHGLRVVERRASNFLPTEDGRYLLSRRRAHARTRWRGSRRRDAARLAAYGERLEAIADVLRDLVLETPPNVTRRAAGARRCRSCCSAARSAGACAKLDMGLRRELLALFVEVGGRLSRRLVRERPDQGGVRLRRRRRQLRQPLHARLRLRAAAPRVRRGERQEGRLGPRHRRHGRDHPGDGQGRGRARRRDPRRRRRCARCIVEGGRAVGVVTERGETLRAAAWSPTSIRSCCT